jgi:hypothetical protein
MPGTTVFKNFMNVSIPPDGTRYFVLGPHPALGAGAVSVTAQAVSVPDGGFGDLAVFLEVIQTATRRGPGQFGEEDRFLDIVVRNNAHVGGPPSGQITAFNLYTSIDTP